MQTHSQTPPLIITLLSHNIRWNIVQHLLHSDYRVNELVDFIGQPPNLVSYHLKQMRSAGLVVTRRSDVDARDIYYGLDLAHLREAWQTVGQQMILAPKGEPLPQTTGLTPRVLFICTHNSARSQMAEAILRHLSAGRVAAFSAGQQPGQIHPDTIQTMQDYGINIQSQTAKHLSQYEGQPFDYVISVCDKARESCPTFPGEGRYAHWGYSDPTAISDAPARQHAFRHIAHQLHTRIQFLLAELN